MFEAFQISLRESFQCFLLLALVLFYPPIIDRHRYALSLVAGFLTAVLVGFAAGYLPATGKGLIENETWTFWRYVFEAALFYAGIVILIRKPEQGPVAVVIALFVLGFLLPFFEARALGYILRDLGVMHDRPRMSLLAGLGGFLLGMLPFALLYKILRRLPLGESFTVPSLLMVAGSLQLMFGGVKELENENILVPLQRALLNFIGEAMHGLQALLLVPEHRFLAVDGTGLADYLASDRIALSLAILFLTAPPIFLMSRLFARPDPGLREIDGSVRRRSVIAAFRRELISLAAPVLTSFALLMVLVHAVNISMNPLYDPVPLPVHESGNEKTITIPIVSKTGDLGDKKLRKYIYYHGNKEILFLILMKQNDSLGVALDQCEICKPADWNKDARGYAQKGEHLICKYCVTPVPASALNTPGGCNPIPFPFTVSGNDIVIRLDDLIRTFEKAEALERKGTHL